VSRWEALLAFLQRARELYPTSRSYIVGGAVRDFYLNGSEIPTAEDIDLATSLLPQEIKNVAKSSGFEFQTQGAAFLVSVVKKDRYSFEVATFRKERSYKDHRHPTEVVATQTVEEDAARRDFTINAIYYNPLENTITDPVGGMRDATRKILRAIGNPTERFTEDYIRVLRLFRFQAQHNLQISPRTLYTARQFYKRTSMWDIPDRVWKEISKLVVAPFASKVIFQEDLFTQIVFPFLEEMKELSGRNEYHPEDNVLEHVHYVFENAQILSFPTDEGDLPLLLAALYHDAAKPATRAENSHGGYSFHDHENKSATLAYAELTSLGAPTELAENVAWLIEHHLDIKRLSEMRRTKVKRLYEHDMFYQLANLGACDNHGGSQGPDYDFLEGVYLFLETIPEGALTSRGRPKLISGNDLIALEHKPGPLFRKMLEAAEEFELYNPNATKEDVLKVAILAKELSDEQSKVV